jgi:hypothetical protein
MSSQQLQENSSEVISQRAIDLLPPTSSRTVLPPGKRGEEQMLAQRLRREERKNINSDSGNIKSQTQPSPAADQDQILIRMKQIADSLPDGAKPIAKSISDLTAKFALDYIKPQKQRNGSIVHIVTATEADKKRLVEDINAAINEKARKAYTQNDIFKLDPETLSKLSEFTDLAVSFSANNPNQNGKPVPPTQLPILNSEQTGQIKAALAAEYKTDLANPYQRLIVRHLNAEKFNIINGNGDANNRSSAASAIMSVLATSANTQTPVADETLVKLEQMIDEGGFVTNNGQKIRTTRMTEQQKNIVVAALKDTPTTNNSRERIESLISKIAAKNDQLPFYRDLALKYQESINNYNSAIEKKRAHETAHAAYRAGLAVSVGNNGLQIGYPLNKEGTFVVGGSVNFDGQFFVGLQNEFLNADLGGNRNFNITGVAGVGNLEAKTINRTLGGNTTTTQENNLGVGGKLVAGLNQNIVFSREALLSFGPYAEVNAGFSGAGAGVGTDAGVAVNAQIGGFSIGVNKSLINDTGFEIQAGYGFSF